MFITNERTLRRLAAIVWHVGAVVLLVKGATLLGEAGALHYGSVGFWIAVTTALVAGALKARFIFSRSCQRNLVRIEAMRAPRVWQFYTPGFFLLLAVMITAGAILSRLASGRPVPLIAVAALDLSIAVALIAGGGPFWKAEFQIDS